MSTRAKVLVLSLVGLLVVAGIAVTVTVLVIQKNHKDDIAKADAAAADFLETVADFRDEQMSELEDGASDSPDALRDAIDAARDDAPALDDAPKYGRENSDDYADAVNAEQQLLDDLDQLESLTDVAEEATDFILATQDALDRNRPADLVGVLGDGAAAHIRDAVIPAFEQILDDYRSMDVPEGYGDTADLTAAALQHVIDNLALLADAIDANQSYYFEFDQQYGAAEEELEAAGQETAALLDAAIEAFGAGEQIDDGGEDEDSA